MTTEKKTTEEKYTGRRLRGTVVSAKSDKTVVILVERRLRHKLYDKLFTRSRKFHVHDEKNQFTEGDVVDFIPCRPMSKQKRWRVVYNSTTEQ